MIFWHKKYLPFQIIFKTKEVFEYVQKRGDFLRIRQSNRRTDRRKYIYMYLWTEKWNWTTKDHDQILLWQLSLDYRPITTFLDTNLSQFCYIRLKYMLQFHVVMYNVTVVEVTVKSSPIYRRSLHPVVVWPRMSNLASK